MNILRLAGGILAICTLSYSGLFAQCPSGNVILSSQADVNAFFSTYGSCSNLPGDLIIGDNTMPIVSSDISDLSGLSSLNTVGGNLIIRDNPLLPNLDGLQNLTTVTLDFTITENLALTDIDDLSSLSTINMNFEISYNDNLTYISNLNNLNVTRLIRIMANDNLATISGLNNVTALRGLEIRENNGLSSITGISNYTPGLSFNLLDNPILSSIPNFSFTTPAMVNVTGNSSLSVCDVPGFCQATDAGLSNIFDLNGVGCNSVPDVEEACASASLPVELISFEVNKVERTARLNWITASEKNNQGFFIEHSMDGQRWNTVDFVQGNGNSTSMNSYQFTHNEVFPNQNYYRLKQLDYDGTTELSKIKRVNFEASSIKEIVQVYPNPNSGSFRIVTPTTEGIRTNLLMTDVQGRIIWETNLDGTEGSEVFFKDFDQVSPQLYFLHIQNGADYDVRKIQVLTE